MKAAQSKQKAYADQRRKSLEFIVGDKVFLNVSLMKGITCVSRKSKLDPRYVGPFEVLERVGSVAYRLALPLKMEKIHNVFHISQLRKYMQDPSHIIIN